MNFIFNEELHISKKNKKIEHIIEKWKNSKNDDYSMRALFLIMEEEKEMREKLKKLELDKKELNNEINNLKPKL